MTAVHGDEDDGAVLHGLGKFIQTSHLDVIENLIQDKTGDGRGDPEGGGAGICRHVIKLAACHVLNVRKWLSEPGGNDAQFPGEFAAAQDAVGLSADTLKWRATHHLEISVVVELEVAGQAAGWLVTAAHWSKGCTENNQQEAAAGKQHDLPEATHVIARLCPRGAAAAENVEGTELVSVLLVQYAARNV